MKSGLLAIFDALNLAVFDGPNLAVLAGPQHIPMEYSWHTSIDEENYLLNLSLPITAEEYNALRTAKDCFEVLIPDT